MRVLDQVLREGLERANPVVCDIIEITAPDATQILRRANDQFFTSPPRFSETPGGTTAADANGALILAPTNTQIASLYTINSETDIGEANPSQILQGMGWTIDPAYGPVVLKKFTAKIERYLTGAADFQLQIYRPKVQRQFYRYGASGVAEVAVTTFLEVLPEPVVIRYASLTWTANRTDLVFDLSAIRPVLTPGPVLEDPIAGNALAQNPMYLFVINPIRPPTSNAFRWKTDTTSAITYAGVGTFQRTTFTQATSLLKVGYWPDPVKDSYSQCFKLEIEQYPATSVIIYAVTLPSVPLAASTLRAIFERGLPTGTSATLEISTTGTGGPWTPVKHGASLEPRTNLALQSQTLDNASWVKARSSIGANTDTAPDGTLTADRIIEDATATSTHQVWQSSLTITANVNVVYSKWFKAGTRTWIAIRVHDSTNTDAFQKYFNLATGALGATFVAGTGALVRAYTELGTGTMVGWVRCVLVGNVGNGRTSVILTTYMANADNGATYSGDGASYVIAWGAQFENATDYATDYIPTGATAVTFGGKQLAYHVRVTLNASASLRQTPRVTAVGLDGRIPIDVSAEATTEPVGHEIQMPFCQAGIGEGRVSLVRAGRRDYRDVGSDLAVGYPASKLEVDHYIGSRHPKITRDHWLLYERASVTNREPSETLETFAMLSPLKALKKKIPLRIETINTVHTVTGVPTTGAVAVTPNLSGAAGSGDYLGKGYYMRVRTSAQPSVGSGFIQRIDDNTGLNTLVFTTPVLPGLLVAGDIVEVHSGQYAAPVIQWTDADPADIWYEILTTHLSISPEKIGLGGAGQASRSGFPPKVTDRAPGDATTQAKLKVTMQLKAEEDADKLIDQLSFLMGGATVGIAGQYVFRQIYPLRDVNGSIAVPTARPDVAFDARDYTQLQTPTGIEARATTCSCNYGVNATASSADQKATSTVTFADADAIAYLAPQDVEGLGQATIPKEIARWCYNASDAGLFLATQLAKQVVLYSSTGLRVWSWVSVNAHPELHIGDSVWVVTDQYTDYDPTRKLTVRGWVAYRVLLTSIQAGGRRFRGVMPGLGAAVPVKGGPGTLPVDPTSAPTPAPTGVRINYVSSTDTTETIQFNGTGIGVVQYRWRIDNAAWSSWLGAALPQTTVITRALFYPEVIDLQVMQADGQITQSPAFKVHGQLEGLNPGSGRHRRLTPSDDGDYTVPATTSSGDTVKNTVKESGGKAINRQFAKPLAGDPDTIDSTPNGLTFRRVTVNATDSSGNVDLAGSGWINKHSGNIARSGANATAIGTIVTNLSDAGTGGAAGFQESGGKNINRLFAKALLSDPDSLDSAPDGTTYKKVTGVNGSNLITPSSSAGRNRCRVRNSGVIAVAHNTRTAMTFDTEDTDVGSWHNPATNPSYFTIPTPAPPGAAMFFAQFTWDSSTAGTKRSVVIRKNNTTLIAQSEALDKPVNGLRQLVFWVEEAPTAGDFYEFTVIQDSGVSVNVTPNWAFVADMW